MEGSEKIEFNNYFKLFLFQNFSLRIKQCSSQLYINISHELTRASGGETWREGGDQGARRRRGTGPGDSQEERTKKKRTLGKVCSRQSFRFGIHCP